MKELEQQEEATKGRIRKKGAGRKVFSENVRS
jgi:hypothetical protein